MVFPNAIDTLDNAFDHTNLANNAFIEDNRLFFFYIILIKSLDSLQFKFFLLYPWNNSNSQ